MSTLTTTLHKVKETTRFVAFETAEDEEPVLGRTYVTKAAIAQLGDPETIIITIREP